ncbi:hypothetical protein [Helicobacter himalayensis]|uniref:hypothetical protein n=1 Tax=Helicobacter himalayensis TaxID=1591088 RepID=UPI00082AB41E|nr:hypothetical protein [Helicobacter himalayensis]
MKAIKEHSTSFYLSEKFLSELDFASELLGISRSILVNRAIYAQEGGFDNANKRFKPKKAKKVFTHKGKYKAHKQAGKKTQDKQKSLLDFMPTRLSYIFV